MRTIITVLFTLTTLVLNTGCIALKENVVDPAMYRAAKNVHTPAERHLMAEGCNPQVQQGCPLTRAEILEMDLLHQQIVKQAVAAAAERELTGASMMETDKICQRWIRHPRVEMHEKECSLLYIRYAKDASEMAAAADNRDWDMMREKYKALHLLQHGRIPK